MNWRRIGLECGALGVSIAAWLALMLLLAPLFGSPPITENPLFYLSSLAIGLLFHGLWSYWRTRRHAKNFTKD